MTKFHYFHMLLVIMIWVSLLYSLVHLNTPQGFQVLIIGTAVAFPLMFLNDYAKRKFGH
ncbi:hypothetical protein LRR81_07645 [Metabacillus sp. GX 13764]|uniref:hypothetical protein n=1 Tax=Metabacillus kandeliae TaxID=2900151 RepID=UPI001E41D312|nr:hypothetical protein [Metabacillus kandeliae]MCD7034103.1 hypothetical protein [Metabacillus kandeliae]